MSVGDWGVLSTRPRNRRGYGPPGTHARQNEFVCDQRVLKYGNTYSRAKKYNYTGEIVSGRKYIPHSQSPLNVSVRIYIPHSRSKENVSVHRYITHNFSREIVCGSVAIAHDINNFIVCVIECITHGA